MAKDPAFLFYPNDWIGGTMGMTFEEKGAYVELLMYQFNRGHMTKHMITRMIGQLWVNLEVKFRMDDAGLYYNERLDKEKERRKKFTESRRNNVLGKNQHQKKVGHMTSHMENENIYTNNTNKVTNKEDNTNSINRDLNSKKNEIDFKFWESEKQNFLQAGDWIFKFCRDKDIKLEVFDKEAKTFLDDIELKEDFKEAKELKRHFTNWYNLNHKNGHNKFKNGTQPNGSSISGTSVIPANKKYS
jgi:hypothetical protein